MLPPSPLGYRTLKSIPIPPPVETAYREGVLALLNIEPNTDESGQAMPFSLSLSRGARREWKEFGRFVEADMREGRRFEFMKDWAGKLSGAAARIAGLLHCAEQAKKESWAMEISLDTMKQALEFAAVLSQHALLVFDLMGSDPVLDKARKVWRWIERNQKAAFTARECFQAMKGAFPRMSELDPAFKVLIERSYIWEPPREQGKRGRPTHIFMVHPKLSKGW